jgi:SAM-dependent methyltransferase
MLPTPIDYDDIADLYDLYVTVDYDHGFFLEEAARTAGPILELTSGTGRLSVPLLEAGATLTCVDRSRRMLAVLAQKLRERDLHASLICADLCTLALDASFPLAILPFQSIMEIVGEDRRRQAFRSVRACLSPGGVFICTMHNPAIRRGQVDGTERIVGRFPIPGGTLVVSGIEEDGRPVVRRRQLFSFFDRDERLLSTRMLPMEFELIERGAFEAMANEAGFVTEALFGNYDRSPFEAATSPVMIWMLRTTEGNLT